jgi:threonylcarbamoyladenosine tRNA methylthiotransferase MtaB
MQIGEMVTAASGVDFHGGVYVGDPGGPGDFLSGPVHESATERTRPNLKIQDGCNNRCSFCIIPSVRGRSRSAHPDQVVEQVAALSRTYREIVLTGINLGRWGREPGLQMRLVNLLRRLLAETEIEKIRLSSIEPMDFSDDLLELMAASHRICKHVHAPLQSGSDSVLRRMHRKYRPWHYEQRIRKARQMMPEAAIGADVMTGFPGETDAEFEESREFIENLPFTYLHVFTYSERPGTPAAALPQVPVSVRRHRNQVLREIAERKNRVFRAGMIGRQLDAVTLSEPLSALTDNYLKVRLAEPREPNRLIHIEVGGVSPSGLMERSLLRVLR